MVGGSFVQGMKVVGSYLCSSWLAVVVVLGFVLWLSFDLCLVDVLPFGCGSGNGGVNGESALARRTRDTAAPEGFQ